MQCKDFVVGVLDLCRDTEEVEAPPSLKCSPSFSALHVLQLKPPVPCAASLFAPTAFRLLQLSQVITATRHWIMCS